MTYTYNPSRSRYKHYNSMQILPCMITQVFVWIERDKRFINQLISVLLVVRGLINKINVQASSRITKICVQLILQTLIDMYSHKTYYYDNQPTVFHTSLKIERQHVFKIFYEFYFLIFLIKISSALQTTLVSIVNTNQIILPAKQRLTTIYKPAANIEYLTLLHT